MRVTEQLARDMAAALLGRQIDECDLDQVSRRLSSLLDRVRTLDERLLQRTEPAMRFPADLLLAEEGLVPDEALASLGAATPGSSGYDDAPGASANLPHAHLPLPEPCGPLPGPEADLLYMSATEVAGRVRRREISPVELTRLALQRIERLNPHLHAFITVTAEAAMDDARQAEAALMRGDPVGPLCGLPVAVKDIFSTAGVRTTAGSRVLEHWLPDRDATAYARLKAAGAILIGKTQTHEFAYGTTSQNAYYGSARNPWDSRRIPGGSSGGSAIAAATGMAWLALGTDTAGSVRIPAAACGVIGLKPTYGRISRHGVVPLSWSQDTVGTLTRSVPDAALMFQVLAGTDPLDPTTFGAPASGSLAPYEPIGSLRGVRIGYPTAWFATAMEPQVSQACRSALDTLQGLGADVVEVDLPPPEDMMLVNRLITLSEASSYHEPYLERQLDDYDQEVRIRLQLGGLMLARDYLAGQRLRTELCHRMARVMQVVDAVFVPALPMRAPFVGQKTIALNGGEESVLEALIRYTSPFNVTGQPAVTVPCGLPDGLPTAFQLVGRAFDEQTLLRVAAEYEAAAGLRLRPPI